MRGIKGERGEERERKRNLKARIFSGLLSANVRECWTSKALIKLAFAREVFYHPVTKSRCSRLNVRWPRVEVSGRFRKFHPLRALAATTQKGAGFVKRGWKSRTARTNKFFRLWKSRPWPPIDFILEFDLSHRKRNWMVVCRNSFEASGEVRKRIAMI